MISQLIGQISHHSGNFVILDVAGVGYKVFATKETMESLKNDTDGIEQKTKLWTHLAVREKSLDLYGFLEQADLDFFEKLIGISGIGPKTALGVLNVATVDTLISAISSGDTSYLTKVSGIGQKNAQRIILELKNKIANGGVGGNNMKEELDAIDALKALGYSTREAADALRQIDKSVTDIGEKIKEAIKFLGK